MTATRENSWFSTSRTQSVPHRVPGASEVLKQSSSLHQPPLPQTMAPIPLGCQNGWPGAHVGAEALRRLQGRLAEAATLPVS